MLLKRAMVAACVAAMLPVMTGSAVGSLRTAHAGPPPLRKAGTATVKADPSGCLCFRPAKLKVAPGTKVIWKNVSTIPHTVSAYSANWTKSTKLAPGATTSFVFKKKGTYKYRCKMPGHSTLSGGVCSGMCGVVVVG